MISVHLTKLAHVSTYSDEVRLGPGPRIRGGVPQGSILGPFLAYGNGALVAALEALIARLPLTEEERS